MASTKSETLHKILVGSDFSETARVALDRAIAVGKLHGSQLHLVHAIETYEVPKNVPLDVQQLVTEKVEGSLADLERIVGQAGLDVTSEFHVGKAWKVLADAERRTEPDLMVVGTRGQHSYPKALLGSTADRVIRHSIAPVLTVHPADVARPVMIKTVLVATDFSEEAARATSFALRLLRAQPVQAKIVMVHACHMPMIYETEAAATVIAQQLADDQEQARRELESLAASLRSSALTVETVAEQGHPVSVIEDEARRSDADLIVLGTHGRTGITHVILGSIAERVIHHAPCPVLTVRHPGAAQSIQLSAESSA